MENFTTLQWSNQVVAPTSGEKSELWLDDKIDSSLYFYSKRTLDIILASLALIVLSPIMLIIAILIKLDSSGPALFIQERVGSKRRTKNGQTIWDAKTFPFYKFRSMTHNADDSIHQAFIKAFVGGEVEESEIDREAFKLANDPRITRIGHLIRKTSLDELPQLFNVIKGDMSLVGPRPVPTYEAAEYKPWHRQRLNTLQGITGFWQVTGRCQVTFEEMVSMDIEYIRNQSLWLDIKILLLTIPAILSGRGAG